MVAELLAAAPGLMVLVTSRAPLHVAAEHEFPCLRWRCRHRPIPRPRPLRSGELFVERAQAVKPGFALTSENAAAVTEICLRLDGLPLALALAAARAKVLSPRAMLDRLDQRLGLLADGRSDLPERQRTLDAAIGWSYDLLADHEKQVFARLAVFAGAARSSPRTVCDCDAAASLDIVSGLVDHSLLAAEDEVDEPRVRLLETIREFARKRLDETGDAEAILRRHAEHFASFAEEADPHLRSAEQVEWLARVAREQDNLRAALAWSAAQGAADLELRLATAQWQFWLLRGHLREGSRRLEAALLRAPGDGRLRRKALDGAAALASAVGDHARARTWAEENLTLSRDAGDAPGIAHALRELAGAAVDQGDNERARSLYTEIAELEPQLDRYEVAVAQANLGYLALVGGDFEEARRCSEANLAVAREIGDRVLMANSLHNLAIAAVQQGRSDDAVALVRETLALCHALGYTELIAYGLDMLAAVAVDAREPERAARLLGAAEGLLEATGARLEPAERAVHDGAVAAVRATVDAELVQRAWSAGRALAFDDAVALALATCDGGTAEISG